MQKVTAKIIGGNGDSLSVGALPCDGTFPTGTAQWEKRNIALEIPVWEPDICIQCAKCAMVCPHAAIRMKVYDPGVLVGAPPTFKSMDYKGQEFDGMKLTIQTAPEDCTGCGICVHVCPAKSKTETRIKALNMMPQPPLREPERENYSFFLDIPEYDRRDVKVATIKGSQVFQPLFEYSGACAGCGETPYLSCSPNSSAIVSSLRTRQAALPFMVAICRPHLGVKTKRVGDPPGNSLFEDNAEFGLGFRLTLDKQAEQARELVERFSWRNWYSTGARLIEAVQDDEADIYEQRLRVEKLKTLLKSLDTAEARNLLTLADCLVKKSVWIVGGDGWAYDIGYGGLDHVLASGKNVNVLVLDTEVYSNTGGQMSKSTPRGAVAKFAAGGKAAPKKDLDLHAMIYGNVYVAQIAMGAGDLQTVKAFVEAEAYDGPSFDHRLQSLHCARHQHANGDGRSEGSGPVGALAHVSL